MNFDQLTDRLLPVLQEILARRLKYSRSWNNVSISTGKRYLDITWCEAKDGNTQTQTKRVQPFNADTLINEIRVQFEKLQGERQ